MGCANSSDEGGGGRRSTGGESYSNEPSGNVFFDITIGGESSGRVEIEVKKSSEM